ncbi:hypothetical protein ACOSQ2_009683 [Xanthoceras sorbifolium]
MPNSWRILLGLDLLCIRECIVFELPDLFYTYSMREHDTEKGRYNLNLQPNRKHLITELTTNDRSWKDRYFFAKGLLVEWPVGDTVVRTTWSKAANIGAPQAVVGLTCATRTAKILSYDVKERSWKSILSEENLRPSHLWKFSVINEPGTPYPAFKNLVEFVRLRHCIERLYDTRFLTPISYVERQFAVDLMAGEIAAPGADDAMRRLREKRKGKKKA